VPSGFWGCEAETACLRGRVRGASDSSDTEAPSSGPLWTSTLLPLSAAHTGPARSGGDCAMQCPKARRLGLPFRRAAMWPSVQFPNRFGSMKGGNERAAAMCPMPWSGEKWQGREFRARMRGNRAAVNASTGSNCVL